jgi:hypothetical protein
MKKNYKGCDICFPSHDEFLIMIKISPSIGSPDGLNSDNSG